MDIIADILLIVGALTAAAYCIILSRRLRQLNDLEKGVGGAIAVLSAQVDDMTKTLSVAKTTAVGSNESLANLTERAEEVSKRLEILVASMHDLPSVGERRPSKSEDAADDMDQEPVSSGFRSARNNNGRAAA